MTLPYRNQFVIPSTVYSRLGLHLIVSLDYLLGKSVGKKIFMTLMIRLGCRLVDSLICKSSVHNHSISG